MLNHEKQKKQNTFNFYFKASSFFLGASMEVLLFAALVKHPVNHRTQVEKQTVAAAPLR